LGTSSQTPKNKGNNLGICAHLLTGTIVVMVGVVGWGFVRFQTLIIRHCQFRSRGDLNYEKSGCNHQTIQIG
jgi:hypothetical protein